MSAKQKSTSLLPQSDIVASYKIVKRFYLDRINQASLCELRPASRINQASLKASPGRPDG